MATPSIRRAVRNFVLASAASLVSGLIVPVSILRAQVPGDTAALPEIVVTATRYPVPPESLSATLTVLKGDDLRAQGISFVADALREVPGLHLVQGGSFGAATSLFTRGGESDYTKVLVDGVPVNQPGGAYDFASLTTDNVERIEVLRGPASVLYGSDAVSGVVQIITRDGAGPTRVDADAEAGTFGTVRWSAAAHGGTGGSADAGGAALGWSGSLSRLTTDGAYAFNNAYRNTAASVRLRARPDAETDAALTFRFTDGRFAFPTDFTGALTDRNQFNTDRTTTVSLDVSRRLARGLEGQLLVGRNAERSGFDNTPDPPPGPADVETSRARVRRETAEARALYTGLPRTTLMAGVALDHQHEHSTDESDFGFGATADTFAAARHDWGFYAQASAEPGRRVRLSAGGRLDRNSRFGDFWTWRTSALVLLTPATRLRASAGNAFKEPSFFENFATGPFATGNPNLAPERTQSFEGGIEQDALHGHVTLSITGFAQRFRDLIQFTGAPPAPGAPNYFNIAAANASGIEASVDLKRLGPVGLTAGYTWLHTRVTDAGFDTGPDANFVTGERLLRRPGHALTLRAYSDPRARAQLGAELEVVGARDDLRFAQFPTPTTRIELPAYATLDLSGHVRLLGAGRAPGLGVTLRVENVFDKDYEQVAGFPARGRTLLVGLASSYR